MDEGTSSMPKAEENIDLIIETAEFDGSGMRYDTSMFGPKTHQCEVCGYVASNHGCLVIHRRTHTGEKPFRCDQCDYASTRKGNLVRHKEIHTENKAMCAVCHMMLKSVNLKRHYKIRHPEIPIPDNFGDMIVFDNTSQGMVWSSSNEITDGSDHGSFVIEDVRTVQSTNYAGNESNHVDHFNKGLYNPSIASDSERSLVLNINNGVITREAYEDMPSHHAHMRETSHNYIENAATVRNMANVHSRPLLSERFMGNPECSKSSFAATSNQINCTATAMTRESTPPYSTERLCDLPQEFHNGLLCETALAFLKVHMSSCSCCGQKKKKAQVDKEKGHEEQSSSTKESEREAGQGDPLMKGQHNTKNGKEPMLNQNNQTSQDSDPYFLRRWGVTSKIHEKQQGKQIRTQSRDLEDQVSTFETKQRTSGNKMEVINSASKLHHQKDTSTTVDNSSNKIIAANKRIERNVCKHRSEKEKNQNDVKHLTVDIRNNDSDLNDEDLGDADDSDSVLEIDVQNNVSSENDEEESDGDDHNKYMKYQLWPGHQYFYKYKYKYKCVKSRQFKCPKCDLITFSAAHLKCHMRSHLPVWPGSISASKIRKQSISIPKGGKWKCNRCDYTTSKCTNVNRHHNKHAKEDEGKQKANRISQKKKASQAKQTLKRAHNTEHHSTGSECGTSKRHKSAIQVKHGGKACKQSTSKLTYNCSQCSAVFYHKSVFDNHQLIHSAERSYKCNQCGISFKKIQALKAHACNLVPKTHHIYRCQKCDFKTIYIRKIRRHIQKKHTGTQNTIAKKLHTLDKKGEDNSDTFAFETLPIGSRSGQDVSICAESLQGMSSTDQDQIPNEDRESNPLPIHSTGKCSPLMLEIQNQPVDIGND